MFSSWTCRKLRYTLTMDEYKSSTFLFYSLKVSWIRKRDLHILASENFVFSGDQRFSVLHPANSTEWDLKIETTTIKDTGVYECQVNTEPKIKLSVFLEVTGENTSKKQVNKNFSVSFLMGGNE